MHVEESGGSREVSVEPNIVPFIDLMSVMIIFLLITAVWTQVSMIQIGSSVYGKKSGEKIVKPPPKVEVPFRLDVIGSGYRIIIGRSNVEFEKVDGEYDDQRLIQYLKQIKETYPEKNDAIVTIWDELPYGDLIRGMDALLSSGFAEISVSTVGVK